MVRKERAGLCLPFEIVRLSNDFSLVPLLAHTRISSSLLVDGRESLQGFVHKSSNAFLIKINGRLLAPIFNQLTKNGRSQSFHNENNKDVDFG